MPRKATALPRHITVEGIDIEIIRKSVKTLRLGIYPPEGRVRASVPLSVGDDAVRRMVLNKLEWVRRHQSRLAAQPRPPRRELVNGETIHLLGQAYTLRVTELPGIPRATLNETEGVLDLRLRPGSIRQQRLNLLLKWYREQLHMRVPPLLEIWQPTIGVQAAQWGIRRMTSKWGSCNIRARRICLNLELITRPRQCLEYVLVHELVHLLERRHNAHFKSLMTLFLPDWRQCRRLLNESPLDFEDYGAE